MPFNTKALAFYNKIVHNDKLFLIYPQSEVVYTHYYNTWNGRPNDPSASYTLTEDCILHRIYHKNNFSDEYTAGYVFLTFPNGTQLNNDEFASIYGYTTIDSNNGTGQRIYDWIIPKGTTIRLSRQPGSYSYSNSQAYLEFIRLRYYSVSSSFVLDNLIDL